MEMMAEGDSQTDNIDFVKLRQALKQAWADDDTDRFAAIVNTPFSFKAEAAFIFLGIIMLVSVDEKRQALHATAVASTEFAGDIDSMAAMPVDAIRIPLSAGDNLLVKAVASGQPEGTTDWSYLLRPVMNVEQARFTQASGGIAYSAVYPLDGAGADKAIVYSFFRREAGDIRAQDDFMKRYTALVADFLR